MDQEPTTMKDYDLKNSVKIKKNNLKELHTKRTIDIVNRLLAKADNENNRNSLKRKNKDNCSNLFYLGFDLSTICKKSEYINYSLIKVTKKENDNNFNKMIEDNNLEIYEDDEELSFSQSQFTKRNSSSNIPIKPKIEKNVHKSIGKYCGCPSKIFLSFYCDNKNYDKPLGKFLFDLCKESQTNCPLCGIQLSKHIHHLYKSNGRIKIKLISEKENDLDKIIYYLTITERFIINNKIPDNYNNLEIYTYGYCNICQDITTPLFKLPNDILNYSTTKLFRFLVENLNIENITRDYNYNIRNIINSNKCNHNINKDISRIFVTNYGSWLFEYNNLSNILFRL